MKENDKKRSYAWNMHYGSDYISKQKARELRKGPTKAEVYLWTLLRNRQLGYKFRRQHSIGIYIADFYCHEIKLVIEVDGDIHTNEQQNNWDNERTRDLNSLGIEVIRFDNKEVFENTNHVLQCISQKCIILSKKQVKKQCQ